MRKEQQQQREWKPPYVQLIQQRQARAPYGEDSSVCIEESAPERPTELDFIRQQQAKAQM